MEAPSTDSWPPLLQAGVWIAFLVITAIPTWLGYVRARRSKPDEAVLLAGDVMSTRPMTELSQEVRELRRTVEALGGAVERSATASDRTVAASDRAAEAARVLTRALYETRTERRER